MKKLVCLSALFALNTMPLMAQDNIEQIRKDTEVISNILQVSLKQGLKDTNHGRVKLSSVYLAGQGLVFEVDVRTTRLADDFDFSFDFDMSDSSSHFIVADEDELGNELITQIREGDWGEIAHEAMETAHRALEHARERLSETSERQREIGWELKEYRRELRDIEFEMSRTEQERKKELRLKRDELRAKVKELEIRRNELASKADALKKEQKEKKEERLAKRQKDHEEFISNFETTVSDTVCRYGASVKTMPKSEHVSFVLTDVKSPKGNRESRDLVYVFNNKDIVACSNDKMDASKLLANARRYEF